MRAFLNSLLYKNKTFVGRIFLIFAIMYIINFLLAGALLYYTVGDNINYETRQKLLSQNIDLQSAVSSWLANDTIHSNRAVINTILSSSKSMSGADVWIVNDEHEIQYFSKHPDAMNADIVNNNGRFFLKKNKQYTKVQNAGRKGITEVGDFYGLFSNSKSSYLTVALPMKILKKSQDKNYAVYMFIEQPGIMKTQKTTAKLYLFSSLFCTSIALLLLFVWTRRMNKPLIEMSEAAHKMAEGQYGRRVDERYPFELGKLAHNFNIMAENIEKNDEIRKEFIANVSHELRTPMTSMRGFIDAILDGTVPVEKQDYYLNIVRDEILRLDNLTNELLDFSRFEAGKFDLNYETFDIAQLVKNVLVKLEHLVDDKMIYVNVNLKSSKMFVNADKEKIERVFINLVSNAIKFVSNEGHISIDIDKRDNILFIKIEDDGPGIHQEDLKFIFDRFYKVDKSRSQNKSGTGLGLCIVKQIIEAHGHKVWAESKVGEGTAFFFTLNS